MMKKDAKSKPRAQSKLAELLGKHGIRYAWQGTWPTIPVALKSAPFDAPPPWVDKIRERIFEIVLPLRKHMTLEFYDAAIFGYAFSAMKRELEGRWANTQNMLPGEAKDEAEGVDVGLSEIYEPALEVCRRKRAETAVTFKGFQYGVKCQRREAGWTYSTRTSGAAKLTTWTVKVYETMLRNWRQVERLTKDGKSSLEIGAFVARKTPMNSGQTLAQYHEKYPEQQETYRKTFQTICGREGLPLPPRGSHFAAKPAP